MFKNKMKLMLAGIVALCAFGSVGLKVASADAATQTTRDVVVFGTQGTPNPIVVGESTLIRKDDGIRMRLRVDNVPPGVYTAWIPIFNTPVGPPRTAGWVDGTVVGRNGKLRFNVRLDEGEILEGHPMFSNNMSLNDARLEDIGMVIRYHGEASDDPDELFLQLTTFEPDPNDAVDAYFTRHNAP